MQMVDGLNGGTWLPTTGSPSVVWIASVYSVGVQLLMNQLIVELFGGGSPPPFSIPFFFVRTRVC